MGSTNLFPLSCFTNLLNANLASPLELKSLLLLKTFTDSCDWTVDVAFASVAPMPTKGNSLVNLFPA